MNILNFAWNAFVSIAQKDFDKVRLILDEHLTYPVLSSDEEGYVAKIPVPRRLRNDFYTLHEEYYENNACGWLNLWRAFKASVYHAALHVAYSDFGMYKSWAKGKDLKTATFCVSLVEDLYATFRAAKQHPGILYDIAYSNYASALRLNHQTLLDKPLRYATVLLLAAWGLEGAIYPLTRADAEAVKIAQKMRELVFKAVESGDKSKLIEGAQVIYSALHKKGLLREVPSFPYTESHGRTDVFKGSRLRESQDLLRKSFGSLGLEAEEIWDEDVNYFLQEFEAVESKVRRLKEHYEKIIAATRLEDLEIPRGDYAMFLRTRARMAGAIASIKNQLRLVKTAEEEVSGDESGHLDLQTAVQIIASENVRNDVFIRDEKIYKREAWAILLDASKSIRPSAPEVKRMAVCLAEVARDVIPVHNLWGLFAFNNRFIIVKDFNEQYSMDVKARIGGLSQGGYTFLPDAIFACSKALSLLPVEPRILVVVSDGYPVGYAGIERELALRVRKTSKAGILLLGVGITNPSIRDFFTVNCELVEPYQMMKFFVKAYFELSSFF